MSLTTRSLRPKIRDPPRLVKEPACRYTGLTWITTSLMPPTVAKHAPSISYRSHPNRSVHVHQPPAIEQIHADLGEISGRHFLVMVDSFSDWPHMVAFRDTNTSEREIIEHVRSFFSNVGALLSFWSDNGSQFGAVTFRDFLAHGVSFHSRFPTKNAKSNGRAESEINTMKSLIRGSWTAEAFNEAKFTQRTTIWRSITCTTDFQPPDARLFAGSSPLLCP